MIPSTSTTLTESSKRYKLPQIIREFLLYIIKILEEMQLKKMILPGNNIQNRLT